MDIINFVEEKAKKMLPMNDVHGGTAIIKYKNTAFVIGAPLNHIKQAVELINKMSFKDRKIFMKKVNKAIKQGIKAVNKNKSNNKTSINLCQDVTIWYSNEIIKGNKSIEELELIND